MSRKMKYSRTGLETTLGVRGNFDYRIYKSTKDRQEVRRLMRRWATTAGIPSALGGSLSIFQLEHIYNDVSNALLDQARSKLEIERAGIKRMIPTIPRQGPVASRFKVVDVISGTLGPRPGRVYPGTDEKVGTPRMVDAIVIDEKLEISQEEEIKARVILSAKDDAVLRAAEALIRALPSATLDKEAVREIAIEVMAGNSTRIDMVKPDGTVKAIGGYVHKATQSVIIAVRADIPVWLVGPAGGGKTTLARQVAEALSLDLYSVGALDNDFRLLGFMSANGVYVSTVFRQAYEHGGVFLFDEVDASSPRALLSFNQALGNGECAFADKMVVKHRDFRAIAAANTWGQGADRQYVGRLQLDAATLDRFVSIAVDYDESLERAMVPHKYAKWVAFVQKTRAAVEKIGLRHVVSPRASLFGAALIEGGLSVDEVLKSTLYRGLGPDDLARVKAETGEYHHA